MGEDTIQDLKQFVAATISQQVSDVRSDLQSIHTDIQSIRTDIQNLDNKLTLKMDDLSKSVAEAIENTNDAMDAQLHD